MEAFVGSRGGSAPITRILVLSNFPFYEKLKASLKLWLQKAFLDIPSFEICHLDYRVIFPLKRSENLDPQEPIGPLNELVKVVDEKKVQAIFWEKLSLEELDLVYHALKASVEPPIVMGASQELYETVLNPVKLKIFAQSAGLNLFPWSGMACRVDPETNLIRDTEYDEAFTQDADSGLVFAERYRFPILLNSGVGSGECTSERIDGASRLVVAFTRFRSAGPNSVFLSKVENGYRQIDLIVFSDHSGKVDYLLGFSWEAERDNGSLWGELPQSPNQIDTQKMEISCKALVKSLKYSGVATVSFWFKPNDRTIYFKDFFPGVQQYYITLEDWMGFSLPAIQLQLAIGIPLDSIDSFLTQPRSFSTLLTKEAEDKYLWETSPKKVAPVKGYHFVVDAPVSLFLKTLGKSTDMPKSIEELSIVSLEEGQYLFLRPASVLLTASGKSAEERSLRKQKLLKRMLRWDDFGKMLKKLQTFDQSNVTTSPVGEAIALLPQETHNATVFYPSTSSSQTEDNSDRELQAALLTLKEKLSGKFFDAKKATENFHSILKNQALYLTRVERIQNDISLLKELQDKEQLLARISDIMTK
ncbi:acetyl-coenzyme-A carboxylase [Entomophthora muscae]|uniref:Acetyl-coenzyme-A carboxylase n=1 Tax=Entomophthora muscae TaxID=34485 RepID=A0ACC2USL1_9FUNG|nr:acetyl-coenzyme-A carboxylase [Entomophthora muscae]